MTDRRNRNARLWRAAGLAVASLALAGRAAGAQVDVIRRARDAARDKTPSLESVFGKEPPITTGIEDARDGVPSLDGFEPEWYSPLAEMPHGPDGTILLTPGTYVMVVQSYCLHPGTFGPQAGDGYLHAAWKGPKADLVRSVIARAAEHPEIPQRQVQLLLWAIVDRADMNQLESETRATAVHLLTPAELLDLNGYKLGTVPAPVRDRLLQSVPAPARRVLEAENEMRRLLGSADASYADVERVAVLTGTIPAGEATFIIPEGRWSYHPNGFFIRYRPFSYSITRVDIYLPERFEIRRDASGRIISIGTPDGRRFEPDRDDDPGRRSEVAEPRALSSRGLAIAPAPWNVRDVRFPRPSASGIGRRTSPSRAGTAGVISSRVALLEAILRHAATDAKPGLLALARADYVDLLALQESLASIQVAGASVESRALVREAVHAALARYLGIARLESIPHGSGREATLLPEYDGDGYSYAIAPVGEGPASAAQGRTLNQWPPNQGGALAPGPRQRLAMSRSSSPNPSHAPGRNLPGPPPSTPTTPPDPDPLDKAEQMMGWLGNALDAFGALTDPAGFLGGQPQGQMLNQGFNAAFAASRSISNAMQGGDDDAGRASAWRRAGRGTVAAMARVRHGTLEPIGWRATPGSRRRGSPGLMRQGGAPDYRTLSKPRVIDFAPLAPGAVTADQASAVNAVLATTFRMAMALEAVVIARTRLAGAVAARDMEWEDKQGRALIYLKRTAGLEMVQLARDLQSLRDAARTAPAVTVDEVRDSQRRLSADGWTPAALAVARQLGQTDAQLEASRQRLLRLDPQKVALSVPATLDNFQDALFRYGGYLALLPDIPPPWQ